MNRAASARSLQLLLGLMTGVLTGRGADLIIIDGGFRLATSVRGRTFPKGSGHR